MQRNAIKGFTLLELVIVIIILSILGVIALSRYWSWRVEAERVAVVTVVGNIRSALGLEVARRALRHDIESISRLGNTNPILLLAQAPSNYIGEVDSSDTVTQSGVWYFNKHDKTLEYRILYPDYFSTTLTGLPRTRHQLRFIYTDNNNNRRFDVRVDDIAGLDLQPVEAYSWHIEPTQLNK